MASWRQFRVEKRVPSYYLLFGAILLFFLLGIWLLIPSSEVVPEASELSATPTLERAKIDKEAEHLGSESRERVEGNVQDGVDNNVSGAHKELESRERIQGKDQDSEENNGAGASEELGQKDQEGTGDNEEFEKGSVVEEGRQENKEKNEVSRAAQTESLPLPSAGESELSMENKEKPHNWTTQALESSEEKILTEPQETEKDPQPNESLPEAQREEGERYTWKFCGWQAAMDYIPCLDNKEAIKKLPSRRRFEHRERHCPAADKFPMCLVPLPKGYKVPIRWPRSRNEIWLDNAPHTKLVTYKKDQNWVKLDGDKLIFPGGGTQFKYGALQYIDSVEKYAPDVAWGKHTRVALDIGCGVASFGGFLFDRDVVTMSFAPKDEHEAQVQLALERGIPALSAVMGTQRLPFPSKAFDLAHCARCRIHWEGDDGKWLLEVDRVLRPGGYFVWSATPVYRKQPEDVAFWKEMEALTKSMCWNLTVKAKGLSSGVGFAIYQKPMSNECYESRPINKPPICSENENPDASWYTPMKSCLQKVPTDSGAHGASWPPAWPERLDSTPGWLQKSDKSLFGRPAAEEFEMDSEHWRRVIAKSYLTGFGIDWGGIRNVMDMKAGYGGFAASLLRLSVWVMNVVPIDEPDTLPVIFDRGLMGIYHDWCESFSTYPRTYDLLHVDHLFKRLVSRCKPVLTLLEMDRMLRPQGWVIFREKLSTMDEISSIIESLRWEVRLSYVEGEEQLLVVQKSFWRPELQSK